MPKQIIFRSQSLPLDLVLHKMTPDSQFNLGTGLRALSKAGKATLRCIKKDGACVFCGLRPTHLVESGVIGKRGKGHSFRLAFVAYDPHHECPVVFNVDHIVPKSRGGKNTQDNYQLTCEPCNVRRGNGEAPGYHFLRYRKLCVAVYSTVPRILRTTLEANNPLDATT